MSFFALAFLAGILFFYSQQHIPSLSVIVPAAAVFCLLYFLAKKRFRLPAAGYAVAAGYGWALIFAFLVLSHPLPEVLEGEKISISGFILSLPDKTDTGSRFLFKTVSSENGPVPRYLRLLWQHPSVQLHPGDFFHLNVRLKRIHGLMNPGSMDIEAVRFAEGVGAQGIVNESKENRFISHSRIQALNDQIRQIIHDRIQLLLPRNDSARWLPALVTGERGNIPQSDWEVLRRTGTNHLMAIAGLHLGFISGGAFILIRRLWRCSGRLCLLLPAEMAGGWAALIAGVCYGAISGFLLPAKRACLMLGVGLLGLLLRRKLTAWHAWSLALFVLLLIQPASVLTDGFWLSFGSVALIIFGVSGRVAPRGLWWKGGRVQWVTALGLMPLSVWLFKQYSLVSLAANTIAIPWMGFVLLPLVMLGTVSAFISPTVGQVLFQLAGLSLSGLWSVLHAFSHLSWAAIPVVAPASWCLFVAVAGVLFLLMPLGVPSRWMGILWLMPLMLVKYPVPPQGTAWVTLLDVGQGLSVVVQTETHALVFDAGPASGRGYDAGLQTVVPFLQSSGIQQLDRLVVSHGDNDHAGGVTALLRSLPIKNFVTGDPRRLPQASGPCLGGEKWEWDGVKFAFLYPEIEDIGSGNDSSCVMKISTEGGSVLLTGDIEKNAEKKLLRRHAALEATVIVVPHHGSKTSGEPDFIAAVHPQWALFPVGYRNKYHFPHPSVVERYRAAGVKMMSTSESGAIKVVAGMGTVSVSSYRADHGHVWNKY